ncbi:hypothetical protein AB833_31360 [Chromatiales bacterium (ex Bugula neritina AB1)]|nr:hypothetical protein AB833_31360 [Chromatiales bacterium (ex Bugula neritina AB1)]
MSDYTVRLDTSLQLKIYRARKGISLSVERKSWHKPGRIEKTVDNKQEQQQKLLLDFVILLRPLGLKLASGPCPIPTEAIQSE